MTKGLYSPLPTCLLSRTPERTPCLSPPEYDAWRQNQHLLFFTPICVAIKLQELLERLGATNYRRVEFVKARPDDTRVELLLPAFQDPGTYRDFDPDSFPMSSETASWQKYGWGASYQRQDRHFTYLISVRLAVLPVTQNLFWQPPFETAEREWRLTP